MSRCATFFADQFEIQIKGYDLITPAEMQAFRADGHEFLLKSIQKTALKRSRDLDSGEDQELNY